MPNTESHYSLPVGEELGFCTTPCFKLNPTQYAGGDGAEERMQVQAAAAVRQRRPAGGGHLRPTDRLRHQAGRQPVTGSEY